MKLRFTIHYCTQWGESLHVLITFHSQDGTQRSQDLLMQTEDGNFWDLETAAMMSRQHPLNHIAYIYRVENDEGQVLREEWNLIPRLYHFDATKDYVFQDEWRDRPLALHLYSTAYHVTTGGGFSRSEQIQPVAFPLFRRTILFRVSAPQLLPGQSVALCGSHPALGSWNPSRYLKMEPIGMGEWMLTVNVQGFEPPIEYKYVIVDDQTHALLSWEEGYNRNIDSVNVGVDYSDTFLKDGQVLVLHGGHLRIAEQTWRVAGVCVPVFSLRSEHSYGVGDFGDLRRLVDWAVTTGIKIIQVLPVNDTTTDGEWHDSYPYNITSAFALHPHYVDIEAAGVLHSPQRMNVYHRRRQELNAFSYSDYEAVERVKNEYLQELFAEQGNEVITTDDFIIFVARNEIWLKPYAQWFSQNVISKQGRDTSSDFTLYIYYVQYLLHVQLKAAADYARSKGVVLKGDLPIGVNRNSAETYQHPELFNLNMQTGAPPDAFSQYGQNWGFPTYKWESQPNKWFIQRFHHLSQYFDALRIDHVLGFFRIWEIPEESVDGVLGHFSPALPLTVDEIQYFGLTFRRELYTHPFINDKLIERLFGMHAQYVRENYLTAKAYGLYDLRPEYATQRRIATAFAGCRDENSIWIRDGLMRLSTDVLFLEDPRLPEMYHPRIGVLNEPIFETLNAEEKDAFVRLYNNFFFQRHSFFWGQEALKRLPSILNAERILMCAEDLGMLPNCVEPVLNELRLLTLEIQQMPKQQGFEFSHLDANPIRSVATIATHDMAPLRLWWEESPERRQRYYVTMLQKEGRAPEHLPAHLAEEIIARHLYCPSMLCILQLQDWLSMDAEIRRKNPAEERINVPGNPFNKWAWRMHVTIEELLKETRFNEKVKTMIVRSKR